MTEGGNSSGLLERLSPDKLFRRPISYARKFGLNKSEQQKVLSTEFLG